MLDELNAEQKNMFLRIKTTTRDILLDGKTYKKHCFRFNLYDLITTAVLADVKDKKNFSSLARSPKNIVNDTILSAVSVFEKKVVSEIPKLTNGQTIKIVKELFDETIDELVEEAQGLGKLLVRKNSSGLSYWDKRILAIGGKSKVLFNSIIDGNAE